MMVVIPVVIAVFSGILYWGFNRTLSDISPGLLGEDPASMRRFKTFHVQEVKQQSLKAEHDADEILKHMAFDRSMVATGEVNACYQDHQDGGWFAVSYTKECLYYKTAVYPVKQTITQEVNKIDELLRANGLLDESLGASQHYLTKGCYVSDIHSPFYKTNKEKSSVPYPFNSAGIDYYIVPTVADTPSECVSAIALMDTESIVDYLKFKDTLVFSQDRRVYPEDIKASLSKNGTPYMLVVNITNPYFSKIIMN